jgi:tRNA-specific 2-thiouridylase
MTDSKLSSDDPLVLVAMSGGVDSAVAAAIIKREGHPCLGVTMKLWDYAEVGGVPDQREGRCCSLETIGGARSSADLLDIPFYVMDMTAPFRKTVIDNFISEYKSGRTPNPCVVCNNKIKWMALYARAQSVGADRIATGHYARIHYEPSSGRYELLRGVDRTRDQSYVLYGLTQAQLAVTLFPLGEMLKSEVREMAHALEIPVADTPESREICFVTDDNYRRFLKEKLKDDEPAGLPGPLVDEQGVTVGEHQGFSAFTVGQRRGLNLALGKPYYVRRIDPSTRTVHVAPDEFLYANQACLEQVNWVSIAEPDTEIRATVKIRYMHSGAGATILRTDSGDFEVHFDEPQRALTPGQSAVFYDGERVLGGGLIRRSSP